MLTTPPHPVHGSELSVEAPLFVVFNPRSGAAEESALHQTLQRVLSGAGRRYEVLTVPSAAQLPAVARRAATRASRDAGAVVVAGGDGTINCVAQAALALGTPLGIIPRGTFNYSSRAHGIPLEAEDAARVLLAPCVRPVQVGAVNDRIFLVNASVGLYPRLQEEREHYKRRYGRKRWVAAWAAFKTLLRDHPELTLELERDGQRELLRASTLLVGNNPLQLARLGLSEAQAVQDGQLAALIGEPLRVRARMKVALLAALGRLGSAQQVRTFAFARMTVRTHGRRPGRALKVAVDGEICRITPPLVWSVAPRPLLLLTARQPAPR